LNNVVIWPQKRRKAAKSIGSPQSKEKETMRVEQKAGEEVPKMNGLHRN